VIEDTRKQLRDARERLRASREALAAEAKQSAAVQTADEHESYWPPAPAAVTGPAEDGLYIPPVAPEWLRRVLRRMPPWARPPAVGAAALMALTGIPALAVLPETFQSPDRGLEALGVILLAIAAGAAGGLAFSLTRPRLEPLGRIGDYLTGIVCVFAYLGPLMLLMPSKPGDPELPLAANLVELAGLSVLFGLVVGHSWFYAARKRTVE
jgi:hypothetical protein